MFKKLTLGILGLTIVGGLLFGGNLVPYIKTGLSKARHAAQQQVPIPFQIDAANDQLKKTDEEIHKMVHQIAKEKATVKRLETELAANRTSLKDGYDQMMTLREHLSSGAEYYTAANSQMYTNARVKEDLAHRFELYKTAQQTVDSQEQVLASRQAAIQAAMAKLDEAKAMQRELHVKVENLRARHRVNEVAKTASNIDIDNSKLAHTARMIDDIAAQIDADAEMLQMAPKYFGQIPVDKFSVLNQTDVLREMDEYFKIYPERDVAKN